MAYNYEELSSADDLWFGEDEEFIAEQRRVIWEQGRAFSDSPTAILCYATVADSNFAYGVVGEQTIIPYATVDCLFNHERSFERLGRVEDSENRTIVWFGYDIPLNYMVLTDEGYWDVVSKDYHASSAMCEAVIRPRKGALYRNG